MCPRLVRRLLALVLTLAVTGAACRDGGESIDDTGDDGRTVGSQLPSATLPDGAGPGNPGEVALTLGDLPPGFAVQRIDGLPSRLGPCNVKLFEAAGIEPKARNLVVFRRRTDDALVNNTVDTFETPEDALRVAQAFLDAAGTCETWTSDDGAGSEITWKLTPVPVSSGADRTAAYRQVGAGSEREFGSDIALLVYGRFVSTLSIADVSKTIPSPLFSSMVAASVNRMKAYGRG